MSYVSGSRATIVDPAADLYALISAQLTAHANWQFVETLDITTTRWYVWKCKAAGNSAAADYHVLFSHSIVAGSTALYVGLAEGYDAAANAYSRPASNPTNGASTPAADGSYGGGTTYALTATLGSVASLYMVALTTSTTAYDYWLAVNNDGIFVASRVGTTIYPCVVGTLDTLVGSPSTYDPIPVAISAPNINAMSSSVCYAATTRQPRVSASNARMWGLSHPGVAGTYESWPPVAVVGTVGTAGSGDAFQGGQPIGCRLAAITWASALGQAVNAVGRIRGLWRHALVLRPAAGVVAGDTVTVGGATYVYSGVGADVNAFWYNTSAA